MLPGLKEPIYINPSKNLCSLCKNRTKGSWCGHLVSAGLREGNVYKGTVYKLPLKKCLKAQQPKGRSGTKAPRKNDYKPAAAEVQDAHQSHVGEEEMDLPDPEMGAAEKGAGVEARVRHARAGAVRGHGGPGLPAGPPGAGAGAVGPGATHQERGQGDPDRETPPDIVVTPSTPKVL